MTFINTLINAITNKTHQKILTQSIEESFLIDPRTTNNAIYRDSLKILARKTPTNKTEALTKSMDIYVWVISTRLSYTQIKFSKNKAISGKSAFFVIGQFRTVHSICLNIRF